MDQNNWAEIFAVVLRPFEGDIILERVLSLTQLAKSDMDRRMRCNPQIRLITIQFPSNTRRAQIAAAFEILSPDERSRLYNLSKIDRAD